MSKFTNWMQRSRDRVSDYSLVDLCTNPYLPCAEARNLVALFERVLTHPEEWNLTDTSGATILPIAALPNPVISTGGREWVHVKTGIIITVSACSDVYVYLPGGPRGRYGDMSYVFAGRFEKQLAKIAKKAYHMRCLTHYKTLTALDACVVASAAAE